MTPDFSDSEALKEWLQTQSAFDDYEVKRELGQSSRSRSYLARDRKKDRLVAIKVFNKRLSDQEWEEGTEEARFQMQLGHDHKAKIFRFSKVGSWPFLVTEFIDGLSLSAWVNHDPERRAGKNGFRELLTLFASLSEALLYCHKSGLIHGNIRPSNIIVEKKTQRPVLVDFALVKGLTAAAQELNEGEIFPSPEQKNPGLRGPMTAKSDVWALGMSLFLVARHNHRPAPNFDSAKPESLRKYLTEALSTEDNEAPSWLVEVLESALQYQASHRGTMVDFSSVIFERSLGTPPNKIVLALLTLAILIFVAYYLRG